MWHLLQLVNDPSSSDWISASIYIMDVSNYVGARLYPAIIAVGLLRTIITYI